MATTNDSNTQDAPLTSQRAQANDEIDSLRNKGLVTQRKKELEEIMQAKPSGQKPEQIDIDDEGYEEIQAPKQEYENSLKRMSERPLPPLETNLDEDEGIYDTVDDDNEYETPRKFPKKQKIKEEYIYEDVGVTGDGFECAIPDDFEREAYLLKDFFKARAFSDTETGETLNYERDSDRVQLYIKGDKFSPTEALLKTTPGTCTNLSLAMQTLRNLGLVNTTLSVETQGGIVSMRDNPDNTRELTFATSTEEGVSVMLKSAGVNVKCSKNGEITFDPNPDDTQRAKIRQFYSNFKFTHKDGTSKTCQQMLDDAISQSNGPEAQARGTAGLLAGAFPAPNTDTKSAPPPTPGTPTKTSERVPGS